MKAAHYNTKTSVNLKNCNEGYIWPSSQNMYGVKKKKWDGTMAKKKLTLSEVSEKCQPNLFRRSEYFLSSFGWNDSWLRTDLSLVALVGLSDDVTRRSCTDSRITSFGNDCLRLLTPEQNFAMFRINFIFIARLKRVLCRKTKLSSGCFAVPGLTRSQLGLLKVVATPPGPK